MRRVGLMLFAATAAVGMTLGGRDRSAGQDKEAPPPAPAVEAPPPAVAFIGGGDVVNGDDAMVKQMEQRYGKQLKQMYQSELNYLKDAAGPTKEQIDKISAAGEPSIRVAAKEIALSMRGRGDKDPDPRAEMARTIARSAKSVLSAGQYAKYRKEIDARTAARKRFIVLNLVAMTDRVLYLRADQRDKLTELLSANWDDSWNQTQLLMYGGGQYFPPMPDAKILPLLTEPQKTVWRGIQKGNVRFGWGGFGGFDEVEIEGDVIINEK